MASSSELGLKRARFSWTRIWGECDVQGGRDEYEAESEADVGALAPGQRWSAGRKKEIVLRLLRGEPLDALSRELGVEIYRLEEWRERALAGIDLGLKNRQGDPMAEELNAAKRHIGELSMANELLREQARALEERRPLATRRSRR